MSDSNKSVFSVPNQQINILDAYNSIVKSVILDVQDFKDTCQSILAAEQCSAKRKSSLNLVILFPYDFLDIKKYLSPLSAIMPELDLGSENEEDEYVASDAADGSSLDENGGYSSDADSNAPLSDKGKGKMKATTRTPSPAPITGKRKAILISDSEDNEGERLLSKRIKQLHESGKIPSYADDDMDGIIGANSCSVIY
jgi:hypothetical protein